VNKWKAGNAIISNDGILINVLMMII